MRNDCVHWQMWQQKAEPSNTHFWPSPSLSWQRFVRVVQRYALFTYRVIPGHRNWQIETAVWNLAGFLHCALETRYKRFGQFLDDFLDEFLCENLNFLYENLRFSWWKILLIFSMIFSMIHQTSYYKVKVFTGGVKTRWLGWQFLNGL